jgi:hypothetical protein
VNHPIIGRFYSGPQLDKALRRMPSHWHLEGASKPVFAWWRFIPSAEKLISILVTAVLIFAVFAAFTEARANERDARVVGKALAQTIREHEAREAAAAAVKRCRAQGRTFVSNLSDARGWKVRCTGRPVRT